MGSVRLTAEPLEPREVPSFGAAGGVPLAPALVAWAAPADPDPFAFHSNPFATGKDAIYLDFTGGVRDLTDNTRFGGAANYRRSTVWGGVWPSLNVTPYDTDGSAGAFSAAERANVLAIARAVAEDFAFADVDVTTVQPTTGRYQVVLVGGDGTWYTGTRPKIGGVSASTYGYGSPNFVFSANLGNPKNVADCISHEVGHTVFLDHSRTATQAYWPGWGSGYDSYASLMGNPYARTLTQWSDERFPGALTHQDPVSSIGGFLGTRTDDVGDSFALAASLLTGSTRAGLIGSRTDRDVYRIDAGAGALSLAFSPAQNANLYARVDLYDAAGTLVASGLPSGSLAFDVTANVPAGTYYVVVDGVGKGDPTKAPGFSDYGSLGQYFVTPRFVPAVPPAPPPPAAVFRVLNPVLETSEGGYLKPFTFQARLSTRVREPVTITYETRDGTATAADGDYRAVRKTVTLNPGASGFSITVYSLGDNFYEGDEEFTVHIVSVTAPTLTIGLETPVLKVRLLNDDAPPAARVNNVSKSEWNAGLNPFTFTISMSPRSRVTETVYWTVVDETATAGEDYIAASGSVTFAPNQTRGTFTVYVIADTVFEPDETFRVLLSVIDSDVVVDPVGGVGLIINNDKPFLAPAAAGVMGPGGAGDTRVGRVNVF